MRKVNLREKQVLIRVIEEREDLRNLNVGELIDTFKKEIEAKADEQNKEEAKVVSEFTGAFLNNYEKDGCFGRPEREFIRIDSIKISGYTDEYKRVYKVTGHIIHFSTISIYSREIGSFDDSWTEDKFRKCMLSSKEEFELYNKKYEEYEILLNSVIGE